MIRHTVIFKLKHPENSQEEKNFFEAANQLSTIPGVNNFECLRQISKKNTFQYGLSMEFDDVESYDQYSNHSQHQAFIQQFWLKDVENFLEIDFELFSI